MESINQKKYTEEDRAKEIQRAFVKGKTRDEIAKEFGYKNYKTLDIYMRRKNYCWDSSKKNYVPAQSRLEKLNIDQEASTSSNVSLVISMFQKGDTDAKTIAKRLGFSDHRELAAYMKAKGYKWSSEVGNYQKVHGLVMEDDTHGEHSDDMQTDDENSAMHVNTKWSRSEIAQMEQFMPLLDMLQRHRDKLVDLILPGSGAGQVPRYVVPGIFITKSVHMANTLDQLVREYSKEKNISQRDIFAIALIDFFRRYGYEREVEVLLGSNHSR